jgi:putative ABC transport system permease protein
MLRNYLKSAVRFYKYNKVFTGINLIGLSIALSVSFIILIFIINELSYDHCHKNRKRVFRVLNYYTEFKYTEAQTPYVMSSVLKQEFPQIEKTINVCRVKDFRLKHKDEYIDVSGVFATESDVFDIFTIPIIEGGRSHDLLEDQNALILSRELAAKLFPNQDPVGKEILGSLNGEDHVLKVKAVFENMPENSTFRPQCFVNKKWTVDDINKSFQTTDAENNWRRNFWNTWVLLSKGTNVKLLENQFIAFEKKNLGENPENHYSLQNLSDVYLGSENVSNSGRMGNVRNVRLFSAISLLIIVLATMNYIILSTAVSSGRIKEIGLRKAFGATNNYIKTQLFTESILLAVLVLPIALVLVKLFIPIAGKLFQTNLHIMSSNIWLYVLVYILLTVLIGIASGLYTSSYLSKLKVIAILKNTAQSGKRKLIVRSTLIVIQLVIFCSFVAGTLIIRSQYQFALKKDLGFYKRDVLVIDLGYDFNGFNSYLNNIKSNPNVISAAGTMVGIPMRGFMTYLLPNFTNKDVKVQVEGLSVDYDFINTMGITLLQGRDFSKDFGTDLTQSAILNETAVRRLEIPNPIGMQIEDHNIIGVVKDFNLHSIHSDIPPLEITMTDKYITQIALHYKPGSLKSLLPMLEKEWKKSAPDSPFNYSTIEDLIVDLYSSEKNLNNIITIFALFALLIASLGLFGLTLFVARSRTKEIGIKKVFGIKEQSIIFSFLRTNFVLVTIAAIISIPLTLHFILKWLMNFAYKVNISWLVFGVAYIAAALVVLLTVFFHSYKASRINPIEALRYE